jgi:hypothetical protein
MLENGWDEVAAHVMVRCRECGEMVYSEPLPGSLDEKARELVEPLCTRHKMERQANVVSGRMPAAGGGAR